MAKNLYLDSIYNDLEIQNYNLRFTSDNSQWLSQKLENNLKTIKGEWFANQTLGIDYFGRILKKQPNINDVNIIFRTVIKNTFGVKKLINFNTDYDNPTRIYKITFTVQTEDDEIIEGGLNI